jgi:hypothetical protein
MSSIAPYIDDRNKTLQIILHHRHNDVALLKNIILTLKDCSDWLHFLQYILEKKKPHEL